MNKVGINCLIVVLALLLSCKNTCPNNSIYTGKLVIKFLTFDTNNDAFRSIYEDIKRSKQWSSSDSMVIKSYEFLKSHKLDSLYYNLFLVNNKRYSVFFDSIQYDSIRTRVIYSKSSGNGLQIKFCGEIIGDSSEHILRCIKVIQTKSLDEPVLEVK
jgi:hypothetical protein